MPVISCLFSPCVRIQLTHRLPSQRFDWVSLASSDVKARGAAPAATEKLSQNVTTLNCLSVRGLGLKRRAISAEPGSQPAYWTTQRLAGEMAVWLISEQRAEKLISFCFCYQTFSPACLNSSRCFIVSFFMLRSKHAHPKFWSVTINFIFDHFCSHFSCVKLGETTNTGQVLIMCASHWSYTQR